MLKQDFIERRTHVSHVIPPQWKLDPQGQYYELDLKMCQLKELNYDFNWGKEGGPLPRMASIIEVPSRIVRLDLSLNELAVLDHAGLRPYRNLRELNASLNKISNFTGIEILKYLQTLNLSHNFISKIENLVSSSSLIELNLSMNELTDVSYMPSLINLEVLNISNNKLRSLDGVQSLARLRELHAQRNNVEDIVPLTSCFHLQVLNVADNHIIALHNTVDILAQLRRLEVLSLHGNPVEKDHMYRTEIIKSTNVMTLDNISVRPLPKPADMDRVQYDENYKHVQNIHTLKEAARQAFEERMRDAKTQMADQIGFLQRRIVMLQKEYQEYESTLRNDLDSCLRYLDNLSHTEIGSFDRSAMRDSMGTPQPKPWHRSHRSHADRDKTDYSNIKKTEQVLMFASKELKK
ncbi:internalin I-like [Ruditapes philippinarum]|uniref:internalin I-like n=1 Tax=Ruditapes philippinarum TaxID=129788 RepID=UPI00295B388A|nr:internalin I-like [Ruditapes philippinarum]